MSQTFENRRKILRKVQALANELIQINEAAYRVATTEAATNLGDVAAKVNAILAIGGPATGTAGTTDTISDVIVALLYGSIQDSDVGAAIDWAYAAS